MALLNPPFCGGSRPQLEVGLSSGAHRLSCCSPTGIESFSPPLAEPSCSPLAEPSCSPGLEGEGVSFSSSAQLLLPSERVQASRSFFAEPLVFLGSPCHHWKLLSLSGRLPSQAGSLGMSEIFPHRPRRQLAKISGEDLGMHGCSGSEMGALPHGVVN